VSEICGRKLARWLPLPYSGVLVGMRPCGIILLAAELFCSESKSQVYASIHEFLQRNTRSHQVCAYHYYGCEDWFTNWSCSKEYICYNDACHLWRYARNPVWRDLTECTKMISQLEIVIDKLHMVGHTDKWCKEVCDPHKFRDLDMVPTYVVLVHYWSVRVCVCTIELPFVF